MNNRIKKKISLKAAACLPNIKFNHGSVDSEPHCEFLGKLPTGTPTIAYQAAGQISAWILLKKLFESARDNHYEWLWGAKATPENVFYWAFWEEVSLNSHTNESIEALYSDNETETESND
ncbi:conserved hypothetical protein [Vibrio chagasii]|nr:conserved hypothetical protein [Vibrio chagasii]